MSKILLVFAFIMANIFTIFLIYSKPNKVNGIEQDIINLLKEPAVIDRLNTLKTSLDAHKAFAAVIDDKNVYVYGFSYGHKTQERADFIAFEKCEERRKSKEFNIDKECILLNELIYNH